MYKTKTNPSRGGFYSPPPSQTLFSFKSPPPQRGPALPTATQTEPEPTQGQTQPAAKRRPDTSDERAAGRGPSPLDLSRPLLTLTVGSLANPTLVATDGAGGPRLRARGVPLALVEVFGVVRSVRPAARSGDAYVIELDDGGGGAPGGDAMLRVELYCVDDGAPADAFAMGRTVRVVGRLLRPDGSGARLHAFHAEAVDYREFPLQFARAMEFLALAT